MGDGMLEMLVQYGWQASGSSTVPSYRTGSGVPSDGLGINGDYYADILTCDLYLRNAGTYSLVSNLKRLAQLASTGELRFGAGVPSNTLGHNTDWYVNTTNGDVYYKSTGVYTQKINIKGSTGNGTSVGSFTPTATLFADAQPTNLTDAVNRIAALAKILNSGTPIP